mmetsp:Transcript_23918/g.80745  ORF Transcript_23918/g.80745 Transcript_23918/m.80745 type:complete len:313 (+) Transcript_23918:994-1932(+)
MQRRHRHDVPGGVFHGARPVPGPVRVPGRHDGRHHPALGHGAEGPDPVQGLCQKDCGIPRPTGRAASRQGAHLRGVSRRPLGHALQEHREDQAKVRVLPAGGDHAPHHPLSGAQVAAVLLPGCAGAGVELGRVDPIHQGRGWRSTARGLARRPQEWPRHEDLRGQFIPSDAHQAGHGRALLGPLLPPQEAGGGGRDLELARVRLGHTGVVVPGAECEQRGVEHRDGGHVGLQRQQHVVHQDRQLPASHAEAPRLRGRLQGLQDFLLALHLHADHRRAPERLAVPLHREEGLRDSLQGGLPWRHRGRLAVVGP